MAGGQTSRVPSQSASVVQTSPKAWHGGGGEGLGGGLGNGGGLGGGLGDGMSWHWFTPPPMFKQRRAAVPGQMLEVQSALLEQDVPTVMHGGGGGLGGEGGGGGLGGVTVSTMTHCSP